ncbi:MAG: hypothetical protein IPJ14_17710 [Kineosporiaceae bacterium]|nr:hypothetical protein [Kineosporiaceae bacterium]
MPSFLRALLPAMRSRPRARTGSVAAELDVVGRRYTIGIRLLTLPVTAVAALVSASNPVMHQRVAATWVVLTVWTIGYMLLLYRSAPTWATGVDACLLSALGLAIPVLVAPEWLQSGKSWAVPFQTFACVGYQFSERWQPAGAATIAVGASATIGTAWGLPAASVSDGLVTAGWTIIVGVLARILWLSLSWAAGNADSALTATQDAFRNRTVAEQVRADQQAINAALHDTAASTLLMVGVGAAAAIQEVLPQRAARDLAVLEALHERRLPPQGDLAALLRQVLEVSGLDVQLRGPHHLPLAALPAHTLADAAGEALLNVLRHAGTRSARIDFGYLSDVAAHQVHVVIQDDGVGFTRSTVPPTRRGLTGSIEGRMTAIGGSTHVASTPGEGTRVTLTWPA